MLLIQIALFALVLFGVNAALRFWRQAKKRQASADEQVTIGKELALKIAQALEQGCTLAYTHRDYCGAGLGYVEGRFIYASVHDGHIISPSEYVAEKNRWPDPERLEFDSRESFMGWLAEQTTLSLGGDGNQRVTKDRLIRLV